LIVKKLHNRKVKKIYPASEENDLVVFENNSAKIADVLPLLLPPIRLLETG